MKEDVHHNLVRLLALQLLTGYGKPRKGADIQNVYTSAVLHLHVTTAYTSCSKDCWDMFAVNTLVRLWLLST